MGKQLLVRQGGGSASEVDLLTPGGDPREKSPAFDGDAPGFTLGMRWEQGTASTGNFQFVDPHSNTPYKFRPHATVKLVETATSPDAILAYGRIEGGNDVGRRTPVGIGGDEVEHQSIGYMDANDDFRGLPFATEWVRPAEDSWDRLQALHAAKLNGSSSTSTLHRDTTDIGLDRFTNGHLVDATDPVDLDAKTYPVGTFVEEVMMDVMEEWGKGWGITIHHGPSDSHRCILVQDYDDLAKFTSALKISDQHDDWNPTHATAPVLEPIWRTGAGKRLDNTDVISGLISIYGGTTDDPRHLYVETGEDPDDYEVWIDVYNDDLAENATQAERRANHVLLDRKRPYVSNSCSILLEPTQVKLITAGQAIEVKSVVINQGASKHDYVWRRIVQILWEPSYDGRWWAHLELDRPRNSRPRAGGSQPHSTSPKPAPQPVPDVPGTTIVEWDFEDGNSNDTTNTYNSGLTYQAAGTGNAPDGSAHGWTTASHRATAAIPVSSDTDYVFSLDCQWFFDVAIRNIYVKWNGAGGSESGLADSQYIIKGTGHAQDTTYHASKTIRSPVGATTVSIWWSPYSGIKTDNIIIATAGTVTEDDPDALPDGGDSPYYARSDDPRFTNDDQHLITKLQQRVTNNSGGALEAGDVVVPDTSIDGPAVTTTTTAASTAGPIGVIIEGGADDAQVVVRWFGAGTFVNTTGTPADGDYLFTSTTAGAASTNATRGAGAFGRVVRDDGSGETLSVLLWGVPDSSSGGGGAVATDAIWDAKGDLAVGTGANTASKLTAGADDTILMADSAAGTGLKWVASATPSTQAFGDAAAAGTADTFTRGDHKHAMPADPVTAHAAASDPHTGYVLESLVDAKGDLIAGTADNTVGRLAVGANGKVLTAASGETTGLKWATGSDLSISVGGNIGDIPPTTPGTYDEEFNGTADTLPAGTWDTTPSGSDVFTLNSRWPSLLTVEGTGAATYQWSRTSFTAGATFGIWAKFFMGGWRAADDPQLRLYVTDSTDGERRGIELRVTGTQSATFRGLKRTGAGAEAVWGSAITAAYPLTSFYVGMTRTSNSWVCWVSMDGVAWIKQAAAESQTFTVDRWRMLFKTSVDGCMLGCDWIRYRTDTAFPRP